MDEASDIPTRRRIDGITAIMVIVTVTSLLGAAWLRTRRLPEYRPPAAGALAPPLRLLDVETSEPIELVGLRGKVVWVVFWSADSTSGGSSLAALEPAWTALKAQGRFAMVAAAVESDNPGRVRAVSAASGVKLPVYLASAETCRRFGAVQADPPLNLLIDADGRIVTIARGTSPQTIDRIIAQANRLLEELGPAENTRFASAMSIKLN
jgi:peroxiredoxin